MGTLKSLIARLFLDTAPYEQGLEKTHSLTEKWASKQAKYISKHFMSAFGLVEVARVIEHVFKRVEEISKGASEAGLDPESFQAMEHASKQTGYSMEYILDHAKSLPPEIREAAEEFRRMGLAIPNDKVETITKAMRDMNEFETAGETFASTLVSAFVDIGKATAGILKMMDSVAWLAGGRLGIDKNGEEIGTDLFADVLYNHFGSGEEDAALTERLTRILAAKKMARWKKEKEEEKHGTKANYMMPALEIDSLRTHVTPWQALGAYGGGKDDLIVSHVAELVEKIEHNTRPDKMNNSPLRPY